MNQINDKRLAVCPECSGKKGHRIQVSPYWEDPVRYGWVGCSVCGGTGEISRLELAVYKARGGSDLFGGLRNT
ncbi:hypothetical protein LCGC14_1651480 [marine sediment metagenome]|uniref:Uncharacterized protein n=1 Tax=marine sediment metagenome TaxID=412755 RepID=A0A0F9KWZ9_9ZZZZ